jgi:SAM-dependent methyltransferase
MKSELKAILRREWFFPTWIGIFVNPFFFARLGLAKAIRRHASMLSGKLLDIGCGSKPYKNLFYVNQYLGLDIDSKNTRNLGFADYFYDGKTFPVESESFDSALCNQVLEHVFNPNAFLSEIHRVLKRDGKLLLTVPFVWDEHEQPFDYARYSSFGLKALLEENGFRIIQHEKIGADASTLFQLINAYLYKISAGWQKDMRFIFTIVLIGFVNLLGIVAAKVLPKNPDFFLDQLIIAEKVR